MTSFMRYFLFIFLLGSGLLSQAQNISMEAKAAYLLAEEEFEAGNFENSIKFLDEAGTKLGVSNAKILYLKILCLQALSVKDESKILLLRQVIGAFQNAPDISTFNEEKQLEVAKLKLKISSYAPPSKTETIFDSIVRLKGLKVGTPADRLSTSYPMYAEFFRPFIQNGEGIINVNPVVNGQTTYEIFTVYLQGGKISKITSALQGLSYYNYKDTSSAAADSLLLSLLNKTDINPEIAESVKSFDASVQENAKSKAIKAEILETVRTYTWKLSASKIALIQKKQRQISKNGVINRLLSWVTFEATQF